MAGYPIVSACSVSLYGLVARNTIIPIAKVAAYYNTVFFISFFHKLIDVFFALAELCDFRLVRERYLTCRFSVAEQLVLLIIKLKDV